MKAAILLKNIFENLLNADIRTGVQLSFGMLIPTTIQFFMVKRFICQIYYITLF